MRASEVIGIRRRAPRVTFTYFVQTTIAPNAIKIDTSRGPFHRLKVLQEGNPYELRIVGAVRSYDVLAEILMETFRPQRIRADWYMPDPALIAFIARLKKRELELWELMLADEFEAICAEVFGSREVAKLGEYRRAERHIAGGRR